MRQHARRESARPWVASGAPVSVKAFARRYGVDHYTAYADLIAIGLRLASGDNRWAVRSAPAPKRPPVEPADFDEGWVWIGSDQRMFVVGYARRRTVRLDRQPRRRRRRPAPVNTAYLEHRRRPPLPPASL